MKFLKFFLYALCFATFNWMVLFFAGPVIVKWVITSYSNQQIVPSMISITPKLDINIGRLDFSFKEFGEGPALQGVSRAVRVSWSLSGNKPFLDLKIGPTVIDGMGKVDSIALFTQSFNKFDFARIPFLLEAVGLQSGSFGAVKMLSAEGLVLKDLSKISDLSFSAVDVVSNSSIVGVVAKISGEVPQIFFDQPLNHQTVSLELIGEELSSDTVGFVASKLSADLGLTSGLMSFRLSLDEITRPGFQDNIESVIAVGETLGSEFIGPVNVTIRNAHFHQPVVQLGQVSFDIFLPDEKRVEANVLGDLDVFKVYVNNSYVGTLPPSKFSGNVIFDRKLFEMNSKVQIASEANDSPKVHAQFKLGLQMTEEIFLGGCNLGGCQMQEFDIDYQLQLDDENILGYSHCILTPCSWQKMSHSLQTSNTTKIFESLGRTNSFNPLAMAYLYSLFLSGQPYEEGHKIKF